MAAAAVDACCAAPTADEYELLRMAAVERIGAAIHEVQTHAVIEVDLARTFTGSASSVRADRCAAGCASCFGCTVRQGLPYRQTDVHRAADLPPLAGRRRVRVPARAARRLSDPTRRRSSASRPRPLLRGRRALRLEPAAARGAELEIGPELYFIPWVVTLFTRSLPLALACRVWDRVLSKRRRVRSSAPPSNSPSSSPRSPPPPSTTPSGCCSTCQPSSDGQWSRRRSPRQVTRPRRRDGVNGRRPTKSCITSGPSELTYPYSIRRKRRHLTARRLAVGAFIIYERSAQSQSAPQGRHPRPGLEVPLRRCFTSRFLVAARAAAAAPQSRVDRGAAAWRQVALRARQDESDAKVDAIRRHLPLRHHRVGDVLHEPPRQPQLGPPQQPPEPPPRRP